MFQLIFIFLESCVEAEIIPGDTLAKVALRYNVAISELKRVNNLLNEAEFHAFVHGECHALGSNPIFVIQVSMSTSALDQTAMQPRHLPADKV